MKNFLAHNANECSVVMGMEENKTESARIGDITVHEYLDRVAEELHKQVDHQRQVFRQIVNDSTTAAQPLSYCPLVQCEKLLTMRSVLQETISVLEETRSAFKSKKLEVMRRKLVQVLAGC